MRRRVVYGAAILLLAFSVYLLVLQGSFTLGDIAPRGPDETLLFWAISTLVFILAVTLAFLLFRTTVKLYVARRANQEGSRIQTKLVAGAMILSFMPTFFLVVWGIWVLNRNLDKWFSRPAEQVQIDFVDIANSISGLLEQRARVQAYQLASEPRVQALLNSSSVRSAAAGWELCTARDLTAAGIETAAGVRVPLCGDPKALSPVQGKVAVGRAPVMRGGQKLGETIVAMRFPVDLEQKHRDIRGYIDDYEQFRVRRKDFKNFYLVYLALITAFVLFVAMWIALFLAKQISVPLNALLEAARRVQRGDLSHRIRVQATDEFATLVRVFNDMTRDLQQQRQELENRRLFIEAILESIPTGVLSLTSNGEILRVNRALSRIFPPDKVSGARVLEDLFDAEDVRELRYLMKRALRMGVASQTLDLRMPNQILHLAVTVSAFEERGDSGFVLMIEDTSELLRAQKLTAWNEVARRVAHEIKNPLTPIALSAERLVRQLGRHEVSMDYSRMVTDSCTTIAREVETVKSLVDEFSTFSRFPAARLEPTDLNAVVREALAVFEVRLNEIEFDLRLTPGLPLLMADREQIKRVVINLIDNAAEAMQQSAWKRILVVTQLAGDWLELIVADTGCGVSMEDKERLFLPYFSTKNRGTGLGLAIVHNILSEHSARIRVEDNAPCGTRFIVEFSLPVPGASAAAQTLEQPA